MWERLLAAIVSSYRPILFTQSGTFNPILPEDLLEEIDQFVQEENLDRSAYLREILKKGFSLDKLERTFDKYTRGELSQMEACSALKMSPWKFLDELKARNLYLNVDLEDFLDSSELSR